MNDAPIHDLLRAMAQRDGSDLYLTVGAPATLRSNAGISPLDAVALDDAAISAFLDGLIDAQQSAEFNRTGELNFALDMGAEGRFRVNVFRQRQHPGMVIRRIREAIPTLASLGLPPVLGDLACEKRGLILLVGGTGSGKSTTLAAMLDARNRTQDGHIITIEDPIEFIHDHQRSIMTQREVGTDTDSFHTALKNALRQKPDAILIGEIRDAHVMEQAISMAETGHLCLASLHANNAPQTLERILNFFDKSRHAQILLNLSLNLRAVIAQRLVSNLHGGRTVALEIMLNQGLVRDLVQRGETEKLKEVMAKNTANGMMTFDHALVDMYVKGEISEAAALAEADVPGEVRLAIRQSNLGGGAAGKAGALSGLDTSRLSLSDG